MTLADLMQCFLPPAPRICFFGSWSCVPLAFFLSAPAPSLIQQLLPYNGRTCTGCGACVLLEFFVGPVRSFPFCFVFSSCLFCARTTSNWSFGIFLVLFYSGFSSLLWVFLLWMWCVHGFLFCINPILCVEFASFVAPFSEGDAFFVDDLLLHYCVFGACPFSPFLWTTVSHFVAPFSKVDTFFFGGFGLCVIALVVRCVS